MKTQPWTQDKLAAQQRHDRLAVRWSAHAEASPHPDAAGSTETPRSIGGLRLRLQRVNRIAVMVTPGVVAIAASLFG